MSARAAWKGQLRIAGISFGVRAFSGTRTGGDIQLRQIHRDCGEKIEQHRLCPKHGRLESAEIIHGYECEVGSFLAIEPEELKACEPDNPKEVVIEFCLSASEIDPQYFNGQTYFMVPETPIGQRPFVGLRESLRDRGKVGFARLVIYGRQRLVLVRPLKRLIALTVVEYFERVQEAEQFEGEVRSIALEPGELQLFGQLIESVVNSDFTLEDYRDPYVHSVERLIQQKLAANPPQPALAKVSPSNNQSSHDEAAQLLAALMSSLKMSDPSSERLAENKLSPLTEVDQHDDQQRQIG